MIETIIEHFKESPHQIGGPIALIDPGHLQVSNTQDDQRIRMSYSLRNKRSWKGVKTYKKTKTHTV